MQTLKIPKKLRFFFIHTVQGININTCNLELREATEKAFDKNNMNLFTNFC